MTKKEEQLQQIYTTPRKTGSSNAAEALTGSREQLGVSWLSVCPGWH